MSTEFRCAKRGYPPRKSRKETYQWPKSVTLEENAALKDSEIRFPGKENNFIASFTIILS